MPHNANPLPRKSLRDKFHAAKLDAKTNILLSAAYLLHSVAYNYYDAADELLKEHGLSIGLTKELNIRLRRAYNAYFRDFAELIERDAAGRRKKGDENVCKQSYFHDLDRYTPVLQELIRHVLTLDADELEEIVKKQGLKTDKE